MSRSGKESRWRVAGGKSCGESTPTRASTHDRNTCDPLLSEGRERGLASRRATPQEHSQPRD
eukprot:2882945-Prymnesium_polylepis.2